jgi:hypothetical protein
MHILHFIVSFEYIIFKKISAQEGGIMWNVFQKGLEFHLALQQLVNMTLLQMFVFMLVFYDWNFSQNR